MVLDDGSDERLDGYLHFLTERMHKVHWWGTAVHDQHECEAGPPRDPESAPLPFLRAGALQATTKAGVATKNLTHATDRAKAAGHRPAKETTHP